MNENRPDNMSYTARLCESLILKGRTNNMQNKLDAYLAADRITTEEYDYLVELLNSVNEE
jgi:hypothetical protein